MLTLTIDFRDLVPQAPASWHHLILTINPEVPVAILLLGKDLSDL